MKSILLLFLLLRFSWIFANRFNAKCNTASDCDQYQECYNNICLCNKLERRFWTGEICAICVSGFTVTDDRCYQRVGTFKTWSEARQYCRDRYADLFTWRDNKDQQFIEPIAKDWILTSTVLVQYLINQMIQNRVYVAWAGAKITSVNPHTTQWMDPAGIQLTYRSSEWCDPTLYSGYTSPKEPTSGTRQTNQTEREECVTYNIGTSKDSFLCLADDYCNQKYPFICEMNSASMKLANSVHHGSDSDNINFEQQVPTPAPSFPDNSNIGPYPSYGTDSIGINGPAALASSSTKSSMKIFFLIGLAILLIISGIIGYMIIKKKKQITNNQKNKGEEIPEGRSSFTSSIGSMIE